MTFKLFSFHFKQLGVGKCQLKDWVLGSICFCPRHRKNTPVKENKFICLMQLWQYNLFMSLSDSAKGRVGEERGKGDGWMRRRTVNIGAAKVNSILRLSGKIETKRRADEKNKSISVQYVS